MESLTLCVVVALWGTSVTMVTDGDMEVGDSDAVVSVTADVDTDVAAVCVTVVSVLVAG